MRVELSNGNWAELRDPESLTNGQRKPLMRASASLSGAVDDDGKPDLTNVDADALLDLGDQAIIAFVSAWSVGPLPSEKPEMLDDLPAHDYDRLQAACAALLPRLVWEAPKVAEDAIGRPTRPSTRSTTR